MKRLAITAALVAMFFLAVPAHAQFTVVTGNVTDPNGLPWANGTVSAQIVPSPGTNPQLNGGSFTMQTGPLPIDTAGNFTLRLADNTVVTPSGSLWKFTFNITPGGLLPLGTGSQTFSVTLSISGGSQSITTNLVGLAPALSREAATTPGPVFNVVSYGYKTDWRQSLGDGTCSGGSPTLGSASAAFTASDIGKHVVIFVSGSSIIGGGDLTIASVQSATSVTLSGNIPSCGSSGNYKINIFTDNGTALNNAEKACIAAGSGTISIPSGNAGVVTRFFFNQTGLSNCSYIGQGSSYGSATQGVTDIHISPWTNSFSTSAILAFLGNVNMRDMMFDGDQAPWPNTANAVVAVWSGAAMIEHVAFNNFSFVNSSDVLCNVNSDNIYALDLECDVAGFPAPGGTALQVHSLYFNCISCYIQGEPALNATDMGNTSLIGGTYNGLGGNIALNLTGTSGGGKTNIMADARVICTGTTPATACIVYTTNTTLDLQNVTFDNQGTSSVVVMNVPASMTVPIPNVGGLRQRGAGTIESINVVGSIHDAGGDDNFTITGGGQILGNSGSNGLAALCAAVGTSANPSVAACGAAASGIFSCATASAGNCAVTTTAVTAKSGIQIWQDLSAQTGTALGVTCNGTNSVILPTISARPAGTSFSTVITTPVTNPDCFDFEISN